MTDTNNEISPVLAGAAPRPAEPKKAYSAPTLLRWGAVEDLTAVAGNNGDDGALTGSFSGG